MTLPWKPNHKRGAGILTVLTASSLLLLLGLTVAGTAFHHLSVSNRLHHAQIARNLAEDCLTKGLAQVLAQPTRYAGPAYGVFDPLPLAGAPVDQRGVLTFDETQLPGLNANFKTTRLIQSYNNISGDTGLTIPNTGLAIPEHSLYLRAVGCDAGVERTVECVVWVPPFPYSMAAGGKINISGNSKIASIKDLADLSDPTKMLPGSLVTNSPDLTEALKLVGSQILVTGDVQATGGADISAGAVIKGERRLNAAPVKIPTIDIASYDTSAKTGVTTFNSANGPSQVDGFAYRDGALNFNSGVDLKGGIVYVKGDLTINGPINGEGALIATGKLTITGAGQLNSNNKVALMSHDDLTLTGTSGGHIGASGLLYTEGKLKADYADITGSAAAPTTGSGAIEFSNVNMIQDRSSNEVKVVAGGVVKPVDPTTAVFTNQLVMIGGEIVPLSSLGFEAKVIAPRSRFEDPVTHELHMKVDFHTVDTTSGKTFAKDENNVKLAPGIYETVKDTTKTNPVYQTTAVTPSSVLPLNLSDIEIKYKGTPYPGTSTQPFTDARAEIVAALKVKLGRDLDSTEQNDLDDQLAPYLTPSSLIDGMMFRTPGAYQAVSSSYLYYNDHKNDPVGETVTFTLNPSVSNSGFINLADRIRVLYWREVAQ